MASSEKKKKSLFKRILKWTGISFLVLIVVMIIIPIIYKDKIKQMVIDEANKTLTADLSLGDFDLTLISTFPNLSIKLNDTKITGRNEFKGVELVNIKKFTAHINLWDVMGGDQIKINAIELDQPKFDVRVLSNGKANYDITIPDSVKTPDQQEPSNFKLSLKSYAINNADIRYDDQPGKMFAELKNLTHEGKGDLTADIIDFETATTIDELSYEMDGISYLNKVKTEAIANLLMEFTEKTSKFTLKENTFKLNALEFALDGFYEMLEKKDRMDLKFNASKATFKDFLSLVPAFYQSGYESMIAKGNLAFNAEIKGDLDDVNLPGWDFSLNVDNAQIKYPDVPGSINNIVIKAASKFVGGSDLDKMTLDVPKFHADFVGNKLDATLKMRNPMTDPLIDARVIAKVDLATIGKVMPLAEGESYNGKLDADITMKGRMSAIEKEQYEQFEAKGQLLLVDMLYKSKDLPSDVKVDRLAMNFSPQNFTLEELDAKMGKSDFQMRGTIDNYLAYVFRDELLKGDFTFTSNNLDLDEMMGTSTPEPVKTEATEDAPATSTTSEPFLIPGNVDFNLNTNINKIKYNGITISSVTGGVKMKEEVASLSNLKMNAMGGTIILNGNYNTKEHTKPLVDFGYNLSNINIQELAKNFVTIEKLAPIARYTSGNISSSFNMISALNGNMEPIYSTLNGAGDIASKMLTVSNFKPMQKLDEALKTNKFSSQTLKDFRAFFKFENGKITVKPFDIKLGKIATTVSGSTSFDQAIDYKLTMNIPKEEIPSSAIKMLEDQLKKVNSVIPNLKIADLPSVIKVNALMGGTVTDPKVTTDLMEALKENFNIKNIKEQVKEQIKDTVTKVIKEKVNEVKEDLNAKKQQILADAQKQADKIKSDAKKAADQIRRDGDKNAQTIIDEAGNNPIKKKAAEIAAKKVKDTEYKKADQVEQEAQKKADDIMSTARTKADQVK